MPMHAHACPCMRVRVHIIMSLINFHTERMLLVTSLYQLAIWECTVVVVVFCCSIKCMETQLSTVLILCLTATPLKAESAMCFSLAA